MFAQNKPMTHSTSDIAYQLYNGFLNSDITNFDTLGLEENVYDCDVIIRYNSDNDDYGCDVFYIKLHDDQENIIYEYTKKECARIEKELSAYLNAD